MFIKNLAAAAVIALGGLAGIGTGLASASPPVDKPRCDAPFCDGRGGHDRGNHYGWEKRGFDDARFDRLPFNYRGIRVEPYFDVGVGAWGFIYAGAFIRL